MAKRSDKTLEYVGLSIVIVVILGFLFMTNYDNKKNTQSNGPAYAGEPAPVNEAGLLSGPPPVAEPAPVDAAQELATRPPIQ